MNFSLSPPSPTRLARWLVAELRTAGARHSAVTLAGTLTRFMLGFVTSILLARLLGPVGYGLIALVSLVLAIADTVGDLGLTYSAVRAIARALQSAPERAQALAHSFFSLGMLANTVTAIAGVLLADPIARIILNQPEVAPYVRLAMLGLVFAAASGFATALLQATRRFWQLAAVQISIALIYLLGVLALAAFDRLDVATVILLGALTPFVAALVGLSFLPKGLFSLRRALAAPTSGAWSELTGFGKWLWVSAILSLLASQLDLLLLGRFASPLVVGVYALAFNLAIKMDIVNQARLTVLLPSVSALESRDAMRTFVRGSLKRSALIAGGLALLIPLFRPFILTFYGTAYEGALGALLVLVIVVLFDLVTTPVMLLGFPLAMPRAMAASDVVRVATLVAAGWLLIPMFGPAGAALARLAARVAGFLFMWVLIARRLKRAGEQAPLSVAPPAA